MSRSEVTTGALHSRTSPVAKLLDERQWSYRTRTFHALGFQFAVRLTDAALGAYLDAFSVRSPLQRIRCTCIRSSSATRGARRRFTVFLDGRRTDGFDKPQEALRYLLWHINREVVTTTEALCLHASAVACNGRAAVFVAPMESGKSTLVAGLVRAGGDYVTDEAVAFDGSGAVLPYPRPIGLDPGSWSMFEELRPQLAPQVERYLGRQWHVPPSSIRSDAVAVAMPRVALRQAPVRRRCNRLGSADAPRPHDPVDD